MLCFTALGLSLDPVNNIWQIGWETGIQISADLSRDRSMSLPYIARGLKIGRSRSPTDPVDTTDLVESESETSLKEKYAQQAAQAAKTPGLHGRRESFLYSQTSQHQPRLPINSRDQGSFDDPDWTPEQEIVTPFAQVLASLREVRCSLQMLSLEREKLGP